MTEPDVQDAIDCELALLAPVVRQDPIQVEALLDPEFREVGASGRFWDRAATISALANKNAAHEEALGVSEMDGRVIAADLVLLTYVTDQGGRRARRSSLWRRANGTWRLIFHQGTPSVG